MTEGSADVKLAQFSAETNPIERVKTLSLLLTRVADGLEVGEIKPQDIAFKKVVSDVFKSEPVKAGEPKPQDWDLKTVISKTWEKANIYLLSVGEQDLNEGFKLAFKLTTLPEAEDRQKRINEWLRGMGMYILSQNEYQPLLLAHFSSDRRFGKLHRWIMGAMVRNISDIKTEADAMVHPEGYSTLQAIDLGLSLKNIHQQDCQTLYQLAAAEKPKRAESIEFYLKTFPELDFLKGRLA